jgi:hypothetical protein
MLLTLDGDHPQIEAIFNAVLSTARTESIELLKFPGGSSLQFQPNDLMKSHVIIHQYVKSVQYRELERFQDPYWMPCLEAILAPHKIDKASVDCFTAFFRQLPTIISKSFTHSTITAGWAMSGICPLDTDKIMEKCVKYANLNEEERVRCKEALPRLVEKSRLTGMCKDIDIAELLGDIVHTEITNMDVRVLNQQRSLWLNQEGVLDYRRFLHAEKERIAAQTAERAAVNELKKLEKKRIQDAQAAQYTPHVDATVKSICFNDSCAKAGMYRDLILESDDQWRGCPFCDEWFCHRKLCKDRMLKHMPICRVRKLNNGTNNEL